MTKRLLIKNIVGCTAALIAVVAYGLTGSKMMYYAVWMPTAAVATYYLTRVTIAAATHEV